jgi:transposase InsO family protein
MNNLSRPGLKLSHNEVLKKSSASVIILQAVDEAVFLYNTRRPHLSLNYDETPETMHRRAA